MRTDEMSIRGARNTFEMVLSSFGAEGREWTQRAALRVGGKDVVCVGAKARTPPPSP